MIDQDKMDSEKRCLAEAVYFEARSEPEAGQAAVAQVVLNRVSSGLYPNNVCGVVYQNRHHYKGCQFSLRLRGANRCASPSATPGPTPCASPTEGHGPAAPIFRTWAARLTITPITSSRRWARALTKMDVIGHPYFLSAQAGSDVKTGARR